ncbi:MAG: ribosomal RNA small subunit methyltransferase A [Myxococcales bacterium]|nr:ribosomal RNA small subunit methyltransferase A [Myxococcales bacterium]MCB9533620.1 ribosomal RNA small subunit methyltransferase A [Myxococcales bacterium]
MAEIPAPGELLRTYGLPAKKRFGQNFLTDVSVLDRIVAAAGVGHGTRVVEIGPGPGALTSRLLVAGATVTAIELDSDAVSHLRGAFSPSLPLTVIEGDAAGGALDEACGAGVDAVVANLPYHVATVILFRLLDDVRPPRMALMFQREVADRVVSVGRDREFGTLGVASNLRYQTRLALRLKPGAFRPPPKVDSAVVAFSVREVPLAPPAIERATRALARGVFEKRRKMLRGSLLSVTPHAEAVLAAAGVEPTARPEALSIEEFVRLGQAWLESDPDAWERAATRGC